MVIGNALFFASHRTSRLNIPSSVFTIPEIAHIGISGDEAAARNFKTLRLPLADSDRARMEKQAEGFVKIHHDTMGTIYGVTIVGANASEAIGSYITAVNHKIKLGSLAADIYPYPTYSEIIQQAGDMYRKTLLTPFMSKAIKKLVEWRR
jgi:pyruvate/2-oxoglutarate dehydrogenase complex dihydrolipoamide dehydrogenase (E3) component